jgi:hypothetical protein
MATTASPPFSKLLDSRYHKLLGFKFRRFQHCFCSAHYVFEQKFSRLLRELGFNDIGMLSDRELLDDDILLNVIGMDKIQVNLYPNQFDDKSNLSCE